MIGKEKFHIPGNFDKKQVDKFSEYGLDHAIL